MQIILDLQGFKQPANEFVVKELSSINVFHDEKKSLRLSYFHFNPPSPWHMLPTTYQVMNRWCQRNLHGLHWNSGKLSYSCLNAVLGNILIDVKTIFVKGLEKKKWLENLINYSIPVVNLEDFGCPLLNDIKVPIGCINQHRHSTIKYYKCAFENVQRMRQWFLHSYIELPSLK